MYGFDYSWHCLAVMHLTRPSHLKPCFALCPWHRCPKPPHGMDVQLGVLHARGMKMTETYPCPPGAHKLMGVQRSLKLFSITTQDTLSWVTCYMPGTFQISTVRID